MSSMSSAGDSVCTIIMFISYIILTFLLKFKSSPFNDPTEYNSLPPQQRRKQILPGVLNLELYRSFKCGPFKGTTERRQSRRESGVPNAIGTIFSVAIPDAQHLKMAIELPTRRWQDFCEHKGFHEHKGFCENPKTLLEWTVPNPELKAAFQKPECMAKLIKLFDLGPGMIRCEGNKFAVYNLSGVNSEAQLDEFWETARSIFWTFAQVATLNLPEWRLPQNNHDWWADGEI